MFRYVCSELQSLQLIGQKSVFLKYLNLDNKLGAPEYFSREAHELLEVLELSSSLIS